MPTIETTVNVHAEVARLRGLAAEMGKATDPLELAVQELATYKTALRETRAERDQLKAQLFGRFGA